MSSRALEIARQSPVAKQCEQLKGFFESRHRPLVGETRVLVQFSFMDSPEKPQRSVDHDVRFNLEQVLEACGFSRDAQAPADEIHWTRQDLGRFILIPSSRDGAYSPELSKKNFDLFRARMSSADFVITLGHSRWGRGWDPYPQTQRFRQVVPVYSRSFLDGLPDRVRGVALIACQTRKYTRTQSATAKGQKLVTVDGDFEFKEGVSAVFEALSQF